MLAELILRISCLYPLLLFGQNNEKLGHNLRPDDKYLEQMPEYNLFAFRTYMEATVSHLTFLPGALPPPTRILK